MLAYEGRGYRARRQLPAALSNGFCPFCPVQTCRLSPMYVNIYSGRGKRMESGSARLCQAMGQEAESHLWEVSPEHELLHCVGDWALEQIVQRG